MAARRSDASPTSDGPVPWAVRRNDGRLLTGAGRYVGDIDLPGQLWMAVVRSPLAHGRVRSIDVAAARRRPGVRAVLTAADLPVVPTIGVRVVEVEGMAERLQPVLADDRVRYVGEPLAVVVADDPYLAEDAAEHVVVDLDPLPVARTPDDHRAVPLWDGIASNVLCEFRAHSGDVDAAFARADVVVQGDFRVQRQTGVPLETRGLVCVWEHPGPRLHFWGATKFIHHTRRALARFFDLDAEQVICHGVDVGGMFGVRGEVYPEDFLVPWAAQITGRPVKWVEDRREHLMTINHSRDHRHHFEVAATADGTLLAFRSEGAIDFGAYPRPIGGRLAQNLVGSFPGPYRWLAFDAVCRGVATNKTPSGTMRAPSSTEAIFVVERAVDMVASRLGMDPLELRRRNLVPREAMPFTVAMGGDGVHDAVYDSGDYPAQLDQWLGAVDFEELSASIDRRRARGERVGLGLACFVDHSGMGKEESVGLALDTTGTFVLGTSGAEFGQGLVDMVAALVADALAVDPRDVRVEAGDSRAHPGGAGTFASRSTIFVGSAAVDAAGALLDEARTRAAALLGQPVDELRRTPSGYACGDAEVHFKEVAPIEVVGHHAMEEPTHGFGIAAAVVRVDAETGVPTVERVLIGYDVGRVIDEPSARGQVQGAAAMGVGGALFEALRFDDRGQPLSTTFVDYLLPSAAEVPEIDVRLFEMETVPGNPLGVKGVGESGIKGVGAAVANAVAQAIGPAADCAITELPIRPEALQALLPLEWFEEPEPASTGSSPTAPQDTDRRDAATGGRAEPSGRAGSGRAGVVGVGLLVGAGVLGLRVLRTRRRRRHG